MAVGDAASLLAAAAGGDPTKALSDLARIAQQQLDQAAAAAAAAGSPAAAKLARIKESKLAEVERSSSGPMANNLRRPSIIHKSGSADVKTAIKTGSASGSSNSQPPPAHSQKPVTLPGVNPLAAAAAGGSGELSQWCTQMLADGVKASSTTTNPAAVLELALRPPTPAAATPSIFVPCRFMYLDPMLDIKKSRPASSASGK